MISLMYENELFLLDQIVEDTIVADAKFTQIAERSTQQFVAHILGIVRQPLEPFQDACADRRIKPVEIAFGIVSEIEAIHTR